MLRTEIGPRLTEQELDAGRLAWPVDGVLFDVEHNGFWHPAWPSRPVERSEALRVAGTELESVPQLGSRYGHRGHPFRSAWPPAPAET
ncbi:hypothetical protein [Streptomyces sp. NPDC085466]|uniref:hypothetical protein n=1 Tax=Streptomyces sp. NPDC085466 TaxID=3365725 RepID=UPI0037D34429